MRQAWITKTVLHEVDALAVELQHLVNAHNNACLSIHTAGMVALVVEPAEIPETLSLDQSRLGLLRTEFAYLSLASTMMAILKNLGRNYPSVSFCIACPWMTLTKVFDSMCVAGHRQRLRDVRGGRGAGHGRPEGGGHDLRRDVGRRDASD